MAALLLHEAARAPGGSLVCSVCGYGIARETPPGPCPMCRTDDAWVGSSRRRRSPAGADLPPRGAAEARR